MGNHVMYDCGTRFLRVIMSSLRALCCLSSVKKQKHDFHFFRSMYNKTVRFLISGIIKVNNQVGVIIRSRRLRLITLTLYIERKKWKSCFCFFSDGKQHNARELDMITLRNHIPRSYMTLPVTLSVLDMITV